MATNVTEDEGQKMEFNPDRAMTLAQRLTSDAKNISLPDIIALFDELLNFANKFDMVSLVDPLKKKLKDDLAVLRELCTGENKRHYSTAQSMLDYEMKNQLVHRQDQTSGTVALFRIHRFHELLCAALDIIRDTSIPDEKLASEFLAASARILSIPVLFQGVLEALGLERLKQDSRRVIMVGLGVPKEERTQWLVTMTQYIHECYDTMHQMYADRGLLNLPLDLF